MPTRLPTKLEGLVLVEPTVHGDERGFLLESFSAAGWGELGVGVEFVQDNHSRSSLGILRGLHFQTAPGQAKLVRCVRGKIWDVAVDLRRGSSTYGTEALIVRASNNYGPRQYPEKLIPLCILNALAGDPLPVYGDGMQVRNWLWVSDFASAIDTVLEFGEPGEVYNVGGPDELANIEVVRRILELTGRDESLISYVDDRLGHDRRYSLASAKTEALGWRAAIGFDEGIERTVEWYRANEWWWKPIRSGEYREYYQRRYGAALG
jgi:hypothetical protein